MTNEIPKQIYRIRTPKIRVHDDLIILGTGGYNSISGQWDTQYQTIDRYQDPNFSRLGQPPASLTSLTLPFLQSRTMKKLCTRSWDYKIYEGYWAYGRKLEKRIDKTHTSLSFSLCSIDNLNREYNLMPKFSYNPGRYNFEKALSSKPDITHLVHTGVISQEQGDKLEKEYLELSRDKEEYDKLCSSQKLSDRLYAGYKLLDRGNQSEKELTRERLVRLILKRTKYPYIETRRVSPDFDMRILNTDPVI